MDGTLQMTSSGLQGQEFIFRELGKISAQLNAMQTDAREFREETSEHRKEVSTTLKDMDERMASVERLSTSNSKVIVEDVMPTVKEVKAWKQRGIGFLAFAGMAGTGLGVVLMKYADAFKSVIADFFK